jgi:Cu+-exporting ATPase
MGSLYASTEPNAGWAYTPPEYPNRGSAVAIETDPVCGMSVDSATSELSFEYEGTTYWFCGRGCMLEFRDDPEHFLAPEYEPSM